HRRGQQPAVLGGAGHRAGTGDDHLSGRGQPQRSPGGVVTLSRTARWLLRLGMIIGLGFIYVPLAIVLINSFNGDRTFAWPPPSWTTDWWSRAWDNAGARSALWTSVKAGLFATLVALVLGTLVSFAVQRYRFFGRQALSLVIVLPIALPGIVT